MAVPQSEKKSVWKLAKNIQVESFFPKNIIRDGKATSWCVFKISFKENQTK